MPFHLDPKWFVPLALALGAVAWVGSAWLVARISGWASLAARFPADSIVEGQKFRFASGALGRKYLPTRYNGALEVTVNSRGLGLSVWFPLRIGSPPLFIPWSAVETASERKRLFAASVEFVIRDEPARVWLRGQAATSAKAAFEAARGSSTRSP